MADIQTKYEEWRAKGAQFVTPPMDKDGWEIRCYMRDPDGYLIEVGQATGELDTLEDWYGCRLIRGQTAWKSPTAWVSTKSLLTGRRAREPATVADRTEVDLRGAP